MTDVRISVAPDSEHAVLNELYVRWGYLGGIAAGDIVYTARADGRCVGLVRRAWEVGVLMLRGMYVAPESQRQGIGSQLLAAFVADLERVPPADCYCVPFAHLTDFYAQGGFAVVDESQAAEFLRERLRRYRAEGHEVLVMRRTSS